MVSGVCSANHPGKKWADFFGHGVVLAVSLAVLLVLLLAEPIQKVLGQLGLDIATCILGLFLTAIWIQFLLGGLSEATLDFINPTVTHGR